MALLGIILIVLLIVTIILLVRDIIIIKKLISTDKAGVPLTPLGKNLYQAIQAATVIPSLLGRENKVNTGEVKISESVLAELAEELKSELKYECLISCDENFSSTDSKLTSAYLSFRDFLLESLDSIRYPVNSETQSFAAFGSLASFGFNFVYIDNLKNIKKGFIILVSQRPIEVSKVKTVLSSIHAELPLRQKMYDLQTEIEDLSKQSSLLRRKIESLAHDAKSPVQALNLILSQFQTSESKELLDLGKVSLGFLNDLLSEFNLSNEGSEEEICLLDIMNDLKALLTPVLHFKNKVLNLQISPEFKIVGHPGEIRRIILNFLSNSVKYGRGNIYVYQNENTLIIEDEEGEVDNSTLDVLNRDNLLDLAKKGERLPSNQGWGSGIINVLVLCDRNGIDVSFAKNQQNGLKVELIFSRIPKNFEKI